MAVIGQSKPGYRTPSRLAGKNKDTATISQLLQKAAADLDKGGDPERVLYYIQQADTLSRQLGYQKGQGECALLMATYLQQQNKLAEGISFLIKAESIFSQMKATKELVRTYNLRGIMDTSLPTRSAYYEKALALLNATGDKLGIATILPDYSEVKMLQAELPAAEQMLKESIRLFTELGETRVQWSYGLLGAVQWQQKEMVEALKNELTAIKIGEQYADTSMHMAEIYNYAALIYFRMGKLEESTQYLYKALNTGKYAQDPMLVVQFRSNLANVLIRQNRLKEALDNLNILEKSYGSTLLLNPKIQMLSRFVRCYSELHDFKSAGRYADQLMEISDSLKPDEYDQIPIYTELNRFLLASGQYDRAKRYVDQQRMVAEKFKLPEHKMQFYNYRFRIDSAKGDWASAFRNFQLYTIEKDAALNEKTVNQLNQLHVQFDTEKKDKEIELQEKNIKILVQQAALQKAQSDKSAQDLALNRQTLLLKQKDLQNEKQQVDLLTKKSQLQKATSDFQGQQLLIRQKNIELLKQENKIQESELQRAGLLRNMMIAGAIGLALILILTYSRYRMKKKTSDKLALQREEIKQKNNSLEALIGEKDKLLIEKEWLVKEVHHRVKNNLQMVISLLNSQSAYLASQDAVAAIRESQRRMHAMSLIHQRLYEKDESIIDMKSYIEELASYLKDSFDCPNVEFVLDLQSLTLDVSKAIPLGLILNEAITNSLKYAFPDFLPGHILITLKHVLSEVELIIADDGVGIEANQTIHRKSLGMSLLKGLTTQIGGTYQIYTENGVEITVRFSAAQMSHTTSQHMVE